MSVETVAELKMPIQLAPFVAAVINDLDQIQWS